jgi:hypothetical protein
MDKFQSRPSGIFVYYSNKLNELYTKVKDFCFNPVQAGFLFITTENATGTSGEKT